jgi:hypothetical protein
MGLNFRSPSAKTALWILLLLSTVKAHAVTLISDLDDTIKHTWVGNKRESIKNGLFSKIPFGGMAALYSEISNRFIVVSGSPVILNPLVRNFLSDANFPAGELILRNYLWENIEKYKLRALGKIIAKTKDAVILVGDDTEKDPEIYLQIQKRFPAKVAAIYIRRVSGRHLPFGVNGFFHPFEIAVNEWSFGRLSEFQLMALADDIALEFSVAPRLYFPKHVTCPQLDSLFQFDAALGSVIPDIRTAAQAVIADTINYCSHRELSGLAP